MLNPGPYSFYFTSCFSSCGLLRPPDLADSGDLTHLSQFTSAMK